MTRFTLREVFWLTLVVAVALGMRVAWKNDVNRVEKKCLIYQEAIQSHLTSVEKNSDVMRNEALKANERTQEVFKVYSDSHKARQPKSIPVESSAWQP